MSSIVDVARFAPFDRLASSETRAVQMLASPLALRKGKALFYQGDRATAAYLLASGSVRSVMYRSDESSIEMGRSGCGDWIGLAETVLGSPYLCDVISEESSELFLFPRLGFEQLLRMSGMRDFFLREMARRYYVLHSQVEMNLPVSRLAHFLLERAGVSDSRVTRCTQEEIAEAIGVTRETVNKHLGRLQQEGLIRVGRGEIHVLDAEELKERIP